MEEKVANYNPVLEHIPVGRENAVTRKELRIMTGLADRDVREYISRARRDNVILNMQDGKGYFRPDPESEEEAELVDQYVNQEESRLKSIGWSLKSARSFQKSREEAKNEQM